MKFLGIVTGLIMIWGSLAQIMPDLFQIRSRDGTTKGVKSYVWGKNTIWVSVILVGTLLGWYIWNLEGRLATIAASVTTPTIEDKTGLVLRGWTADKEHCTANIDASRMPQDMRDKMEIAMVCGLVSSRVDQMKQETITVSQLFTPRQGLQISASVSKAMLEDVQRERDLVLQNIAKNKIPEKALVQISYPLWFKILLLPKGFDTSNIHRLSDVYANGGMISASDGGVEVWEEIKPK